MRDEWQKFKHNKRRQAKRHMSALLAKSNHKCHWCGRHIVSYGSIKDRFEIVSKTSSTITWKENDKTITELFATIDHVVSLADGGGNKFINLVPSCFKCNHTKGRNNTFEPIMYKKVCPFCGKKKSKKHDQCFDCWVSYELEQWLSTHE